MKKLEELIQDIKEDARRKIETVKKDYLKGKEDCKIGVYDKWFRYSREDDGRAYDNGWEEQNTKVKNEKVTFIEVQLI